MIDLNFHFSSILHSNILNNQVPTTTRYTFLLLNSFCTIEIFNLSLIAFFAIGALALNTPRNKNHDIIENIKDKLFGRGKKWVVLVSGSSGWQNYRHQVRLWKNDFKTII